LKKPDSSKICLALDTERAGRWMSAHNKEFKSINVRHSFVNLAFDPNSLG